MNRRRFNTLLAQTLLAAAAQRSRAQMSALPRFSCMLWTLTGSRSFDQAAAIVANAGYGGVEFVGEFHKWSPDQTRRVLTRLQSLHLVVDSMSGVDAGFAVPALTQAFLSQFQQHLDYARQLGCPQVILLSGARVPTLSLLQQQQVAIENLSRAADLAARAQIEIVIEPIDPLENPSIYLQSVNTAFSIVRAVNQPNLKVLYDLYHEQRAFGNLTEKLEANIDLVGLLHVADVPGRHEPGTGEIAYGHIFQTLARLRYHRWIAMEYYPTTDPVASLRQAKETALQAFLSRG